MLDVPEGLGWVCPASAEATRGVLGDSWPPALWWGCPTVPCWKSPSEQDAWLMTLLEIMPSPATKVGSTLRWRGAPKVPLWGPASPGAKQDQDGAQRDGDNMLLGWQLE